MKVKKEFLLGIAVVIFSILACNLPGTSTGAPGNSGVTIVPTGTSGSGTLSTAAISNPTQTVIPASETPSISPQVTLSKNSNCRIGPSNFYFISDQIAVNKVLPVIGQSSDGMWWQIDNGAGRKCWIINDNVVKNSDFSSVPVGDAPLLPGTPGQFRVVDQLCQPGPKIFSLTLSWASGGGETSYRLYRNGKQLFVLKAGKLTYKDKTAPLNKNLDYEIEALNSNGISDRAIQIVPACK